MSFVKVITKHKRAKIELISWLLYFISEKTNRSQSMIFRSRIEAGHALATKLLSFAFSSPIVIALPRGGAILGSTIARELKACLSLLCIQKISHPQSPEYAIGAVTYSGTLLLNLKETETICSPWLKKEIQKKQNEALRRHSLYLKGASLPNIEGKEVIIVDDGLATGLTMECAIEDIRKKRPSKIIVAVPVTSYEAACKITPQVDVFYSLITSRNLGAIGEYYEDFTQVSDEQVIAALHP